MRNRLWNIVAIIIMVGIAVGGYFLGVDPQFAAARNFDEQRATVDAQNEASRAAIVRLIEDEASLPQLTQDLAVLQRQIPLQSGVPAFLDDLSTLADSSGVVISDITPAAAQLYVPPASAAEPAPTATEGEAAAATDTPEVVVDPLAPPAVTNPLVTSENFILIPVSITTTGTYEQVLDFVSGLQSGPRLFLVTGFSSLGGSAENVGQVVGNTTGYIYVLTDQYDPAGAALAQAKQEAAETAEAAADDATPTP